MKKFYSFLFAAAITLLVFNHSASAQNSGGDTSLDQIVAVVNDHIILKSEIDQRVREYLYQMQQQSGQTPEFSKDVWYTVLQNEVQNYVLLDQAKVDSVEVTDEQVDRIIDQRLQQSIQQVGGEEELERQMGQSIVQIRADLRDQYREQLIIQEYRDQKRKTVTITRPEVEAFFHNIPADSLPTIPEQVAVSQIVAVPKVKQAARKEARKLAEQLRDSLINHGKTIEEMARKYSDGPSAPQGGKLPGMVPLSDLVPEYSAAAAALKPGEISEVVETSFGFHVIRLNKRQGDKIDTNHILISVDEESYDDQPAIDKLENLRDSVLTNEDVNFSDLAREVSEDPNTAPQGGRILNPQTGERLLAIDQLDPALYRIVLLLEDEGDISEPKPFTIGQGSNEKRAYRIVRLDEHIPQHTANLEDDYERIKNFALQNKQYKILQNWIDELKEKVYIEYKIPMPERYLSTQSN